VIDPSFNTYSGAFVDCRVCGADRPCRHDPPERPDIMLDLETHLTRQREFSLATFGPGERAKGVVAHIRKELIEIEADPTDVTEWIDVAILAFDGAWRSGATPQQIVAALVAKQTRNESREWPDWRTMSTDAPIEHVRTSEGRAA
jgi:hypothetical protein